MKMNQVSAYLPLSTEPRGSFQNKRMAMDLKKSPFMFMKDLKLAMAELL
jgi:hypothetical protein